MQRYRNFSALRIDCDRHVLKVTLDNPPLNSMTPEAHEELGGIWTEIGADDDVRVAVLTGAGERSFCAGGDLNHMVENWGDRERWQIGIAEARAIIVGMLECPKPIIARINGHAMGLGASMALAADITIMVDDARLGDPHVKIGLTPGDGGALLWPRLCGLVEARRHLLTGLALSGRDAAVKGLLTAVVPRDRLDIEVAHWVDALLSQSPVAVQTTKQALNLELVEKAKRYMGEMLQLETTAWETADHLEAVKAALEKRVPRFKGA